MKLSNNEFKVLIVLKDAKTEYTQREIASLTELSLGTVNEVFNNLLKKGYILKTGVVTEEGLKQLEPYKVNNAIIMAAGMSSRFAPISYEYPKGVLEVKGEVLIERQIRQLLEVGIDDITIVVGYKKEQFFYLADKYNVKIVVNPDYAIKNNYYTLWLVKEKLSNTFICSSDNYFTENPFEQYVYRGYYSAVYAEDKTDEYCLETGAYDIITKVTPGGEKAWYMLGHVYFDKEFSDKFVKILEEEMKLPEVEDYLWEDIYARHTDELKLQLKKYPNGFVYEFDSLEELREFDPMFIKNIDSKVLKNISTILKCEIEDISSIKTIKLGLTNLSFKFTVRGKQYVYRHPGIGTEQIISRESETFSNNVAAKLGIDKTFIYENEQEGWKISHYIDDCIPFDYHNREHVEKAMELGRRLHKSGYESKFNFDLWKKSESIINILKENGRIEFKGFEELYENVKKINEHVVKDNVPKVLCHNDFWNPNFLIYGKEIDLIDWEYSGMSDYASDLGTFICCSDYTLDQAIEVYEVYFQRKLNYKELAHCLGYTALSSFYWFVWALYKEFTGHQVGEYLYIWYRYAKKYSDEGLAVYKKIEEKK
ncbi:NTP transferase domain-containing protein [Fusobacterium sp.]|uniref:NTP transferase domain-containing protein n=1 Tax=Fusobacterium sp. TaxID=68766 RepID=UPI00396CC322